MASEPILAAFDLAVAKRYFALTKPEVNFLIVVTTFAGFYLGCLSSWPLGRMTWCRAAFAVVAEW